MAKYYLIPQRAQISLWFGKYKTMAETESRPVCMTHERYQSPVSDQLLKV